MDFALVTEVASCVHLLQSCKSGKVECVASGRGKEDERRGKEDSGCGKAVGEADTVAIGFQLSSLFKRSSVCAVTISAFSEGE